MYHSMKLHPGPFSQMKIGEKKSELRLNDEKRRQLKVGDTIEFSSRKDPEEKLLTKVIYLQEYSSFRNMFLVIKDYYPSWEENSFIESMREYYTSEEERQWGALEIGIALIE